MKQDNWRVVDNNKQSNSRSKGKHSFSNVYNKTFTQAKSHKSNNSIAYKSNTPKTNFKSSHKSQDVFELALNKKDDDYYGRTITEPDEFNNNEKVEESRSFQNKYVKKSFLKKESKKQLEINPSTKNSSSSVGTRDILFNKSNKNRSTLRDSINRSPLR